MSINECIGRWIWFDGGRYCTGLRSGRYTSFHYRYQPRDLEPIPKEYRLVSWEVHRERKG